MHIERKRRAMSMKANRPRDMNVANARGVAYALPY